MAGQGDGVQMMSGSEFLMQQQMEALDLGNESKGTSSESDRASKLVPSSDHAGKAPDANQKANGSTRTEDETTVFVGGNVCVQEFMHEQGWSDGFPLVAPTPARVSWMLQGTRRKPSSVVGKCAPTYREATVYSIAVNAVMAGCERRHLRWVIAGFEAMISHDFNLHGVHATTMGATPYLILNGSGRVRDGFNHFHGALGSGWRANATVGRALKLILLNIGGGRIALTESTTLGSPMKWGLCISENEDLLSSVNDGWKPFIDKGGDDYVTVCASSSGPEQLIDFYSVDGDKVCDALAYKISVLWNQYTPFLNECTVVICPEHLITLRRSGISSKEELQQRLWDKSNALLSNRLDEIVPQLLLGKKSIPEEKKQMLMTVIRPFVAVLTALVRLLNLVAPPTIDAKGNKLAPGLSPKYMLIALLVTALYTWLYRDASNTPSSTSILRIIVSNLFTVWIFMRILGRPIGYVANFLRSLVPKFGSADRLKIVVTGAKAGKFSSLIPGFGIGHGNMSTANLSRSCTVKVDPPVPWSQSTDVPKRSQGLLNAGERHALADGGKDGYILHKPTCSAFPERSRAPRKASTLEGLVVGLLDLSKSGGDIILNRVEDHLLSRAPLPGRQQRKRCREVRRYRKPTFSRPCPSELRAQIVKECDVVIEALAD